MEKKLAYLALIGFVLSLLVHLCALAGMDVATAVPAVFGLHVAMFAVFIPFVLSINKRFGRRARLSELAQLLPRWVRVLMFLLFAYVIVNFFLFLAATGGGSPSQQENGQFILQYQGKLIRVLTAQEYTAFKANEVRGFSGHWLLFYFVPFAYFFFAKKAENAVNSASLN